MRPLAKLYFISLKSIIFVFSALRESIFKRKFSSPKFSEKSSRIMVSLKYTHKKVSNWKYRVFCAHALSLSLS